MVNGMRGFARVFCAESTILTENPSGLAQKMPETIINVAWWARYFPAPGPLKYLKNSEFESSTSTSLRLLKVARYASIER